MVATWMDDHCSMSKDPSTAQPVANMMLPPSLVMLVDSEYLVQELVKASLTGTAQAGPPLGEELTIRTMAGTDYRGNRREMNFAVVQISGLLYNYYGSWVARQVNLAMADDSVDGLLLDVDTGGGSAVAAQIIRASLADNPKPYVVLAHYSASGGVLATSGADEIIASTPMARIGSVGVMMSLPAKYADLYNKYVEDVYADTSPDKNAAFRAYLESLDTAAFKAQLNELDALFMAAIDSDRPLSSTLKDSTLKGGTWLAEEAKKRGLVDSIGGYNYALTRLASIAANKLAS